MGQSKIKVFHIAKWYPNPIDDLAGIFIPRHIKSTSQKCENYLFYSRSLNNKKVNVIQKSPYGNYKEHIAFYPSKITGIGFLDSIIKFYFYFNGLSKLIGKCAREHGPPDIIHVHVMGRTLIIGAYYKWKWKIPLVLTEHWSVFKDINWRKRNRVWRFFIKRFINKPDMVMPVSKKLGDDLINRGLKKDIEVIFNVVDTDMFNIGTKPKSQKNFRFIHISDFTEFTKNVKGILNSFSLFSEEDTNAELVLVGYGDFEKEIKEHAASIKNIQHKVTFTGKLLGDDLINQIQKSNAFVLFSKYENLPCVIAEAMACGIPIISSDVGGISEIINKDNGILVESENEIQLAKAMHTMVNNIQKYDSETIRNFALKNFSEELVSSQIMDVYQKVI